MKWYKFESLIGHRYRIANPSFEQSSGNYYVSGYRVAEAEFNRVLAEWEADQQIESEPDTQPEKPQWKPKVGDWVRVKDVQVGDCVRGFTMFGGAMHDTCGTVGKVTRLRLTEGVAKVGEWWFVHEWLEPATPQPIDKLGWWLIGGKPDYIITRVVAAAVADLQGIFLAEISDEEIAAYHREGIVPKCPVEVNQ